MKRAGKDVLKDIQARERAEPAFATAMTRERERLDRAAEDAELKRTLRRVRQLLTLRGKRLEVRPVEAARRAKR